VSQLAQRFVKDPAEVVKVGDRLTVRVLSVDLARKRLGLSVRAAVEGAQPPAASPRPQAPRPPAGPAPTRAPQRPAPAPFNNPFGKLKG
jgi:uncharacterized protein